MLSDNPVQVFVKPSSYPIRGNPERKEKSDEDQRLFRRYHASQSRRTHHRHQLWWHVVWRDRRGRPAGGGQPVPRTGATGNAPHRRTDCGSQTRQGGA